MGRNSVRLCQTEKDWDELREVFVRAFMNYPLYQYIAQNESTREEFLRRYLNSHYEIHVKNGNSPLIAIHATKAVKVSETSQNVQTATEQSGNEATRIIGGVLFVAPAKDGIGWDYTTDDEYVQSYNRFSLKEIDEEAFERLKSYEKWETKHVSSKVMELKIPIWNGLFCAIDPAYSGSGCGSMNYKDCMRVMSQAHSDLQNKRQQTRSKLHRRSFPKVEVVSFKKFGPVESTSQLPSVSLKTHDREDCPKSPTDFQMNLLSGLSFMTHHPRVLPQLPSRKSKPIELQPLGRRNDDNRVQESDNKAANIPLVLALSHSRRAVQFHQRNGFRCVKEVPFTPSKENESPFSAFLLFSDVFDSGRLDEIAFKFEQHKDEKRGINVRKCLESDIPKELECSTRAT